MRRNEQDQINYLRNKFDQWYYTSTSLTSRDKRTFVILVLGICVLLLLVLPYLSVEFEKKKYVIYVIVFAALLNILHLLYENVRDHSNIPAPSRTLQSDLVQRGSSPFNPRVEESSKRILRETSEQIESSSRRLGRRPSYYETSTNPKDSMITRRTIQPDYKHHDTSPGRPTPTQAFPTIPSSMGSGFEVFQQYHHQPQNLNKTIAGGSKGIREFEPPSTFDFSRTSRRSGMQFSDFGNRRTSDYSSASPVRGFQMGRTHRRNESLMPSKGLTDEQILISQRDSNYKRMTENQADELLTKLNIRPEFPDWKKNCQRWFVTKLIPKILDDNMANIKELNRIIGYFDKRLHEYEFILKLDQGRRSENIPQKSYSPLITIDELLNYEESVRRGGPLWPSSSLSFSDIHKAHQDLDFLMKTRKTLERYFEIEGFKTFEVRLYILERLFRMKDNFIANFSYNTDGTRKKCPTDAQILSNLFFTFLNVEAANQTEEKQEIYRNFVFKTNTNLIPPNATPEDVYFRQSTTESHEPHYDIISGKELWTAYPGRDNLFCAIVLFIWHIRSKKHGTLGFEDSRWFKELIQVVIP